MIAEPKITVNGVVLTESQSMTVRVALQDFARMLRAGVYALIRMLKERGVEQHPLLTEVEKVLKQTEIKQP